MTIDRFEEIEAWQMARELARVVYQSTKDGKFPGTMVYATRCGARACQLWPPFPGCVSSDLIESKGSSLAGK